MRALIVDDDLGIRNVLASILDHAGFSTAAAASVREGLELAAASQFDVAFVDVDMPDGSGLDVASALLAANRPVRVVVMSGADHGSSAFRIGAHAFLDKPFVKDDVLSALRRG